MLNNVPPIADPPVETCVVKKLPMEMATTDAFHIKRYNAPMPKKKLRMMQKKRTVKFLLMM